MEVTVVYFQRIDYNSLSIIRQCVEETPEGKTVLQRRYLMFQEKDKLGLVVYKLNKSLEETLLNKDENHLRR